MTELGEVRDQYRAGKTALLASLATSGSSYRSIHGLLRKRGELSSQLEGLRAQAGVTLSALDHVDATIRVFKPDIDLQDLPERPVPPPNAAFRGEVQRFLLDLMRKAPAPMTTFAIAEAVMRQRGLDPADRLLFQLIAKRTGHSLTKLRRQGLLVSYRAGSSAMLEWRANVS